jgi:hypothetical protein
MNAVISFSNWFSAIDQYLIAKIVNNLDNVFNNRKKSVFDSPFSILTKMTMTIMTNHSNFAVGRDCPLDMI